LIAAAAIHETLHAYINYNIQTVVQGFPPYNTSMPGMWASSIQAFIAINGLPSNYSDHYQMLDDYFDKSVAILAAWDNNAHSTNDYVKAMLFGLDNGTDGTPTQQAELQTEFNSILTRYGITSQDLTTFNHANLNSTSEKLPKNCN